MRVIQIILLVLSFNQLSYSQCLSGDCQNGFGCYEAKGRTQYIGYFKNGLFEGIGLISTPNGASYVCYFGYFHSHKPENFGFFFDSDDGWSPSSNGTSVASMMNQGANSGYTIEISNKDNSRKEYYYNEKSEKVIFNPSNELQKKSKERFLAGIQKFNYESENFKLTAQPFLAKSKTSSSNLNSAKTCVLPFSTVVPKLTINYYDNRKMCKCCNTNYCQYSYLNDDDAIKIEMARFNFAAYLNYKQNTNLSKEQDKAILECLTNFMVKEYGSIWAMKAIYGDLMYTLFAGTNLSTIRKVGRYNIDSEYCSKRCENDPRCQD